MGHLEFLGIKAAPVLLSLEETGWAFFLEQCAGLFSVFRYRKKRHVVDSSNFD
jgi:hypothetical protein